MHGCAGVVPCGTNGEAPSLSVEERIRVAEAALAAAGGMGVIVGTGAAALPDAIALTRHAFASGADAVLVMPPFYFKRSSDAGIVAFFRRLFDAAVPSGRRVLLYHIPQLTGAPVTEGILDGLAASHPGVVYGLKDSTGDPGQLHAFRRTHPHLHYFVGNDHLVAEACKAGASGSITACANVFPDLAFAVQEAVRRGDDPAPHQTKLSEARSLLESQPMQAATKALLTIVAGLPPSAVRPPQTGLAPEGFTILSQAVAAKLAGWRTAAAHPEVI